MSLYFDYNATTPLDERVLSAMLPFLSQHYANPSSLYKQARLTRTAIDSAREQVAALVGVKAKQVIFTSGGTEANNLALAQLAPHQTLAISAIEHASIVEPAEHLHSLGHELLRLAVDNTGVITQEAIDFALTQRPALAVMMLANNETGVIQPIAQYAQLFKSQGGRVHCDAVQAVGKMPVNFAQLGVDSLSLSSHKIYGAKGVGALIVSEETIIEPLLRGGGQESNLRSGTENVAGIVAFGKAAELAVNELAVRSDYLFNLRLFLEQKLAELPQVIIFAQFAERLPNTVMFGITGIDGEMLLMQLDRYGVALSSGSACASGGSEPSPVLLAMGILPEQAKTAVRISLGMNNTEDDIVQLITFIKKCIGI
jgi:cysteine desulfurase